MSSVAKTERRPGLTITFVVVLFISISVFVLSPTACTSSQDITDLPPLDSQDKGNPKLDSQLNQLVRAERRGEATLFAEQSDIKLVDGSVRVIIDSVPGQLETATEAAANAGAKLETSYNNLLQVVVPVTKLSTLAKETSIHFIRLPQYPSGD